MTAQLIQAPDSKRWHIAVNNPHRWQPLCGVEAWPWRVRGGAYTGLPVFGGWRTPKGICSNCSREVEQSVRLIATVEQEQGQ